MNLHSLDIAVIVTYLAIMVLIGFWVARRGAKNMDSYFLGNKSLPWYLLGISDASGMFDISGTMILVYWLFVYGLKSLWIPWLWPTFNQIFLMMFMSAWVRRSNVLTGAEWIQTRFGRGRGGNLAHLSVVVFALVNVTGLLAYAYKGIGKFAAEMLPWHFTGLNTGIFSDANIYALILLALTTPYVIKGGMITVVATEVTQFVILTITAIVIGIVAMHQVSPEMIRGSIPAGWTNPLFGAHLGLNWTGILDQANNAIKKDGNGLFGAIFGLMFFKGVLASLAGPAPNFDMQRILATRNPREACLMNGWVNVVLYVPRYMMVTGITVLALAFYMPQLRDLKDSADLEKLLPEVLAKYVPAGVVGFLLAGLIAAFMSNFAATINSAPAYLVNDIYKRYINPGSTGANDVRLSRLSSLLFLALGIVFGVLTDNIADSMMWLVGALYGGFVMANVLKWYWWRFNGYGYFWGMMGGMIASMIAPELARMTLGHSVSNTLYLFPFILACSAAGCFLGTFLTQPDDDLTLKRFYQSVNPWGAWGPIREQVVRENPGFRPNPDFLRDMVNVLVGIIWQVSLTAFAIFLVLQNWRWVGCLAGSIVATSVFLKFNWYDHLEKAPVPAAVAVQQKL